MRLHHFNMKNSNLDLNQFKTHPYYHEIGDTYFYFKKGKIVSGMLEIITIKVKQHEDPFTAEKEIKAFFKYRMKNGDTPEKIFPSKEALLDDIEKRSNFE